MNGAVTKAGRSSRTSRTSLKRSRQLACRPFPFRSRFVPHPSLDSSSEHFDHAIVQWSLPRGERPRAEGSPRRSRGNPRVFSRPAQSSIPRRPSVAQSREAMGPSSLLRLTRVCEGAKRATSGPQGVVADFAALTEAVGNMKTPLAVAHQVGPPAFGSPLVRANQRVIPSPRYERCRLGISGAPARG